MYDLFFFYAALPSKESGKRTTAVNFGQATLRPGARCKPVDARMMDKMHGRGPRTMVVAELYKPKSSVPGVSHTSVDELRSLGRADGVALKA